MMFDHHRTERLIIIIIIYSNHHDDHREQMMRPHAPTIRYYDLSCLDYNNTNNDNLNPFVVVAEFDIIKFNEQNESQIGFHLTLALHKLRGNCQEHDVNLKP